MILYHIFDKDDQLKTLGYFLNEDNAKIILENNPNCEMEEIETIDDYIVWRRQQSWITMKESLFGF